MTVLVNFSGEQELDVLLNELYVKNLPVDRLYTIVNELLFVANTFCSMQWTNFVEGWLLKVTFAGEPAVDDGGPLWEFFHLLTKNLSEENKLLCGPYIWLSNAMEEYRQVPEELFFNLGKW